MQYYILDNRFGKQTWQETSNKRIINNAERTVNLYDFDSEGNAILIGKGIY